MLCTETAEEVRDSQSLSTAEPELEDKERGGDLLPLGAEDSLALESVEFLCANPPVLPRPGRADTALLSERSLLCLACIISYMFLLFIVDTTSHLACTSSSPTPHLCLGALQIENRGATCSGWTRGYVSEVLLNRNGSKEK